MFSLPRKAAWEVAYPSPPTPPHRSGRRAHVVATEPLLTNGARQSVSIEAARNLATATALHGEKIRLAPLAAGDYFAEQALTGATVSQPAMTAATPVSVLRLSSADLDFLQKQSSDFTDRIGFRMAQQSVSGANEWG